MPTSNRPFHLLLCALLSLLASVSGCVVGDDPDAPVTEPAATEPDALGLASPGSADPCGFDAMSAATFYQQFAYRDRGGIVPYRLGTTYSIGTRLPNGDEAHLDLYMLANGRVIANYEERHGGGSFYTTVNETVIVTRATIDPASRRMTLAGIGTGTPVTTVYNGACVPGIALTYSQNIRSTGLVGKVAAIDAVWSSVYVIDPDHLDDVPSQTARQWFEEDVAAGVIKIVRP